MDPMPPTSLPPLSSLPQDVIEYIVLHLDFRSRNQFALSCRANHLSIVRLREKISRNALLTFAEATLQFTHFPPPELNPQISRIPWEMSKETWWRDALTNSNCKRYRSLNDRGILAELQTAAMRCKSALLTRDSKVVEEAKAKMICSWQKAYDAKYGFIIQQSETQELISGCLRYGIRNQALQIRIDEEIMPSPNLVALLEKYGNSIFSCQILILPKNGCLPHASAAAWIKTALSLKCMKHLTLEGFASQEAVDTLSACIKKRRQRTSLGLLFYAAEDQASICQLTCDSLAQSFMNLCDALAKNSFWKIQVKCCSFPLEKIGHEGKQIYLPQCLEDASNADLLREKLQFHCPHIYFY